MTNLITAINALDADLQTDGRYAYFAPETQSTWIVTVEDMEALGAILDADEAYQASTERTRSDLLADNSHGDGYSEWCASTSCEEVREEEEEHQPEIDDDTIEQISDEAGALVLVPTGPAYDIPTTPTYTVRRPGLTAWETGIVGIENAWKSQEEANRVSAPGHIVVREDAEPQPEIDDDTIEQLSDEAGAAGDLAMVAICTLALDGNRQARATCAQVISDAHAMRD